MDLICSDLHLSAATPALNAAFVALLEGRARQAQRVFLLGDLFEAWTGDEDVDDPGCRPVIHALRALSDAGCEIHVLPGNRDFLLGAGFAAATGARIHGDWMIADIAGERTLLLHGDTLCTDDLPYMQFRAMVRNPQWQAAFLARPLAERHAMAEDVRRRSKEATAGKGEYLMDANADTVAATFRQHDVRQMIHGHTHRPARHAHEVDGVRCTRLVLADWRDRACWFEADARTRVALTTADDGQVVRDTRYPD
ncbi:UDP-2,3-diacylglucosamine diphosphatase [Methyloversatilis thermotolerans]|uniref:UDP-2,3-diacylglucosamine diphosphatase n=1 Tax=Methyloversatilis thermotolerans TaxID=1346290 RepID=UPI00036C80BE|nr:UDP-2,3-diacylglucosamine diphosphatase [Methyloversatilis thermotolerans]